MEIFAGAAAALEVAKSPISKLSSPSLLPSGVGPIATDREADREVDRTAHDEILRLRARLAVARDVSGLARQVAGGAAAAAPARRGAARAAPCAAVHVRLRRGEARGPALVARKKRPRSDPPRHPHAAASEALHRAADMLEAARTKAMGMDRAARDSRNIAALYVGGDEGARQVLSARLARLETVPAAERAARFLDGDPATRLQLRRRLAGLHAAGDVRVAAATAGLALSPRASEAFSRLDRKGLARVAEVLSPRGAYSPRSSPRLGSRHPQLMKGLQSAVSEQEALFGTPANNHRLDQDRLVALLMHV